MPQSMDPELRRRIEAAADRSDTSVDEWLERTVIRELDREAQEEAIMCEGIVRPAPGAKLSPLSAHRSSAMAAKSPMPSSRTGGDG